MCVTATFQNDEGIYLSMHEVLSRQQRGMLPVVLCLVRPVLLIPLILPYCQIKTAALVNFMFFDCASLYNLVNKTKLVHNLFLVYLSISTCFGRLCAHHQEKQPCLCDTWYLLFCVDDSLVCRSICSCIPDSPDDGPIFARNMYILINIIVKCKVIPLQSRCGPECG